MTLYEKVDALLTAANNTTGNTDTTLTDGIKSLIDGYGGASIQNVYIGTTTTPTTLRATKFITTGFAPKIVGAWCYDDSQNINTYSVVYGINIGAQNGVYFQSNGFTRTYTANNTSGAGAATGHIIGTSNTGFTIQTLETFFAGKEIKLIALGESN